MADRICSFPECGAKHYGKGWCVRHYNQSRSKMGLRPLRPIVKFDNLRDRIEYDLEKQPDGCWIWTRAKHPLGYGLVRWNWKLLLVHRAYLIELGWDVPDGMDVDHLCRVPSCANPEHLEVVTHRENMMRGIGASAVNARKTHCPQGHPYDDENTYLWRGKWRQCRTCVIERNARR